MGADLAATDWDTMPDEQRHRRRTAWRLGVRGVFEVRQEMSRWDVENQSAASSPQ
jgi:hypothetical protein